MNNISNKNKKIAFKLILPDNFNQTLISSELKFEKGDRKLETIRNLLYMYSVNN